MKRSRWIVPLLLVGALVLLALALPAYLYTRPLGPALSLQPAAAGGNAAPAQQKSPSNSPGVASSPGAASTPAAASAAAGKKGICGQTGRENMLLIGQSLPESAPRGADAIRLMVVDYDLPAVRILAMPPDLLVATAGLDDFEAAALTQAFYYGEAPPPRGEPAAVRKATQVIAQAMLDNFSYTTEKYLTMNEPVFREMVDTLDGVEVQVLAYVDGSPEGYGIYEPGPDLMDGQRALDYVRMSLGGEWDRFARQNQVLLGIQAEIVKPENWTKIPALVNDFYHFLVTDLSPKELKDLNCLIAEVGGQVELLEVTPEMVTPGEEGVLIPDVEAIKQQIARLDPNP